MPLWTTVAAASPPVVVGAIAAAYLLGSVPVAVVAARRHGFDPRDVGDGNPGYWNMQTQLGAADARVVFVGDVAKGAAAGAVGLAVAGHVWWVPYLTVGAAMVGHAFPVFARFRGGRSILAFVGGMLVVNPVPAVVAVAGLCVVWAVTRRFDVAARVGVFGFPLVQAAFDPRAHVAATGALMTIIGLRFAQAALAARRPT